MMKANAGGPAWGGGKRALGKISRDWLVERPGRDEDDLERETEDEEERARDLQTRDKKRPPVRNARNSKWLVTVLNDKTC